MRIGPCSCACSSLLPLALQDQRDDDARSEIASVRLGPAVQQILAAQHGAARTTALALLTEGMHEAAVEYSTSTESATETMRAAHERFVADAAALGDADLDQEVELSAALLSLMENHAEQGTLYGLSY